MAKLIDIEPTKTFASKANAIKAAEALDPTNEHHLRFFVQHDEATGRFFPVFVGHTAVSFGVHFSFNVVL